MSQTANVMRVANSLDTNQRAKVEKGEFLIYRAKLSYIR